MVIQSIDGTYPALPVGVVNDTNDLTIDMYTCHDYCGCPVASDTIYTIVQLDSITYADVSKAICNIFSAALMCTKIQRRLSNKFLMLVSQKRGRLKNWNLKVDWYWHTKF